jgi:hypothetical protein
MSEPTRVPATNEAAAGGDPGARRLVRWLVSGVLLLVVATLTMFRLARDWVPGPPPKLVVGRATTFLDGPLDAEGEIDWEAAHAAEERAKRASMAAGRTESPAADGAQPEDGAELLDEALLGFLSAAEWITAKEPAANPSGVEADVKWGIEALKRGDRESLHSARLLPWLEACAAAFAKAEKAAAATTWRLDGTDRLPFRSLSMHMRFGEGFAELLKALEVRAAERTAAGAVDEALSTMATAWRLVHWKGSIANGHELSSASVREAQVVEWLRDLVALPTGIPADRALALLDAMPPSPIGEPALQEALRAERLCMTCAVDSVRRTPLDRLSGPDGWWMRAMGALHRVDPNPHFHRLQTEFDRLEVALFDPSRPFDLRLAAFHDELVAWADRIDRGARGRPGPFAGWFEQDDEVVEGWLFTWLGDEADSMAHAIDRWIFASARRDAAIAEIAARAGAPARLDTLLGRPLTASRRADGSWVVTGDVFRLSLPSGPTLE